MALSKEQVQEIEQKYKITGLTAAFEAEAVTPVTIPEKVNILTDDDLQRVKNDEYGNGKDAGVETAVKAFKTESGLDFAGKTLKGLAEAVAAKAIADAKIAPNEQVTALQADLDKVRKQYSDLERKNADGEALVSKANTRLQLFKAVPSLGEGAMSIEKVITLMESDGYSFVTNENGKMVPQLNGNPIKDNLANVLPVADVIKTYAKENNIVSAAPAPPPGRGAKDSNPPSTFGKLSELEAKFKADGKSTNGDEFRAAVRAAKAENSEFKMNE